MKAKKAPTPARKAPTATRKAPTAASNAVTKAQQGTDRELQVPREGPKLGAVALVAPPRGGRSLLNRGEALKNAEIRLKLAWLHRVELEDALPRQPPFHAHAWTALRVLQGHESESQEESEKAQATLDALLAELVTIRKIVAATTARDDARRERVGFGKTLRATRALLDDGEAIVRGAEKIQGDFPALTPALLARAKRALDRATAAVERSKSREVEASVRRAAQADEQQLALDVLLHSIDHLRAAAMSVLAESKPRLAEMLEAPLEVRVRNEEEDPEPAPVPVPGGEK